MENMSNGEVNYTECIDLTDGCNVENQEESPLADPSGSKAQKKNPHKRSKNFSPTEDETLCAAYLNVSKDPIVGINQSMPSYWSRITEFYNENRRTSNARTLASLQHRWSDIQKYTARFCGFYAEIERRNQSGKSEDDKVKDALQMYAGILESPFKLLHCWLILRYEHKWNTFIASLTKPNAEAQEETPEMVKDHTLPERVERPMGRDKAKKLRSSTASSSTACLEMLQKMQNDRQDFEQRVEEATSAAEYAIAARSERKLALQEENLRVQQHQQDMLTLKEVGNAARADRKLAIQEENLRIQHRMLALQEAHQENVVMLMELEKVSPVVREFYKSKQMELATKQAKESAKRASSTSGSIE